MTAWTPVGRRFFERDALVLARALVGTLLVHVCDDGVRVGRIVETEAYRGPTDLACHARAGLTDRTRSLFGPPGHAYVFLVYGMHECFNVVGLRDGCGHAALIRAVEPVSGIADGVRTSGPGLVTRALGITRAHDGEDLRAAELFIAPRERRPVRIACSARVGVAYAGAWADKPWRFFDPTSPSVSRPPASALGRRPR